jgi:hypothetical protein
MRSEKKDKRYKVRRINPTWEFTGRDENGNMFFEHTTEFVMKDRKRISDKITKELEAKMKL